MTDEHHADRRSFLKTGATAGTALVASASAMAQQVAAADDSNRHKRHVQLSDQSMNQDSVARGLAANGINQSALALSQSALALAGNTVFVATSPVETGPVASANTAALQAAINSFGHFKGGIVRIAGGVPINGTITVPNNVYIQGLGWGSSTAGSPSTYIKWIGSAGSPMFLVQSYFGGGFRDLRIIGNSTVVPTCAIQFDTSTGFNCIGSCSENVWIGAFSGGDTDAVNPQFVSGILFTGTVNGDTNSFRNLWITNTSGPGIVCSNAQAGALNFETLHITACPSAIQTTAFQMNIKNMYVNTTGYNFLLDVGGQIFLDGMWSEHSAGLAQFTLGGSAQRLSMRNVSFQVTSFLDASGYVIDVSNCSSWEILGNLVLNFNAAPPQTPKFNLANGANVDGHFDVNVTSYGASQAIGAGNFITGAPTHSQYFYHFAVGSS